MDELLIRYDMVLWGVLIGLFLGAALGVVLMACMAAASRADEDYDQINYRVGR